MPRSWSPSWCTTGNGGAPWCVPCESIFAAGANASEASDHLFLHRNSMLYCLARVEPLTSLDLKDPRASLALQLGLLFVGEKERSETDEA